MKIKMYPAKNGDSFLVAADGVNILIDGGYAVTFQTHIRADLLDITKRGERLDLLVATHIDADHIGGLITFIAANGPSSNPAVVTVSEIWHNSLRSLTAKNAAVIDAPDLALLSGINRRGMPLQQPGASSAQEISASQGSSLARLLHQGGYKWNGADGSSCIRKACGAWRLGPTAAVRMLGPDPQRLENLQLWWEAELCRMGYAGATGSDAVIDDAFEFLCAHGRPPVEPPRTISSGGGNTLQDVYVPDSSVTNASSIIAVIEMGGCRALFLGDAWAEDVLRAVNELKAQGESLTFDAIKVSHHGSLRNTSVELLDAVDAPVFFISSDGTRHGHPDFEVLAAIVDRPSAFRRKLYLNYESAASERLQRHVSRGGATFTVEVGVTDWIELGASHA